MHFFHRIEWCDEEHEVGHGKRYVGQWENGHMHGQGVMFWPGNWVFVGEFADDERKGRGRCEWNEGAFYDGQWNYGTMDGLGEHGTVGGGSGI